MTAFTTNTTSAPIFGGLFNTIASMFDAAVQRRQFMQTVKELNKLSSAELDDLGLSRGTVRTAAREAVYGA